MTSPILVQEESGQLSPCLMIMVAFHWGAGAPTAGAGAAAGPGVK